MNLKESFRYQKKLDEYLDELGITMSLPNIVIKTTKTHNKSVAANVSDVVEVVEPDITTCSADEIIDFMVYLVSEKEKLNNEIMRTKRCIEKDIDAQIQINKFRRDVCSDLRRTLSYVPKNKTVTGTGYTFNADGNQVSYVYDINIEEEYAYNRNKVRALYDELVRCADETSDEIELAMLNAEVDYTPFYSVNDSLDDAINKYLNM